MKKLFISLVLAITLFPGLALCQQDTTYKKALQAVAVASTGAKNDVLANYLQMAAKSVTSNSSGLQLKLNWFALNSDPHKYDEGKFESSRWQRNGEFIGLYGENSWQLGLNYNLLNLGDTTMYTYGSAYIDAQKEEIRIYHATSAKFDDLLGKNIHENMRLLMQKLVQEQKPVNDLKAQVNIMMPGLLQGNNSDSSMMQTLQNELNASIADKKASAGLTALADSDAKYLVNELVNTLENKSLTVNPLPDLVSNAQFKEINDFINDEVKKSPLLMGATTMAEANKIITAQYQRLVDYVAKRPILTFGYLYNHGKGPLVTSQEAGFTY
jgi:hypothetical protein